MRLFQGYDSTTLGHVSAKEFAAISREKCFKAGIMFGLTEDYFPNEDVVHTAIKIHGINSKTLNKTFHGNFDKVENTPDHMLRYQQYLHYLTTYGAEHILGFYNSNTVYFPQDDQEIPELLQGLKLKVIFSYTYEDIRKKLWNFITSDIAISKVIMTDIQHLLGVYYADLSAEDIDSFTNRELRIWAYKEFGIVPINADDFLRLAVLYATGQGTLIKSKSVLRSLKTFGQTSNGREYMNKARQTLSVIKMAESFNRFKEYWLMLKNGDKATNAFINAISDAAKKCHKPLPLNILQNVMNRHVTVEQLQEAVKKARDIPLIKAWAYCMKEYQQHITSNQVNGGVPKNYRIRNGTMFTKNSTMACTDPGIRMNIIEMELKKRFPHLNDKYIRIPEGVKYPVYTSGKQTLGVIPYGTVLEVSNGKIPRGCDLVVGITWKNGESRVDLDLKCILKSGAFGWDSQYKSEDGNLIFSGDITDAPKPVTEAFLFKGDFTSDLVSVTVNNYTMDQNNFDVPFTITLAWDDYRSISSSGKSYVIDPNKVIMTMNGIITNGQAQQEIGTVIQTDNGFSFIVGGFATDNKMTSTVSEVQNMRREAVANDFKFEPRLNDFLKLFDVKIVDEKTVAHFDLSLERITHDTFQTLLYPIEEIKDPQQCEGTFEFTCNKGNVEQYTNGDKSWYLCSTCAQTMSSSLSMMGMSLTKVKETV